jgi:hypothetical protein
VVRKNIVYPLVVQAWRVVRATTAVDGLEEFLDVVEQRDQAAQQRAAESRHDQHGRASGTAFRRGHQAGDRHRREDGVAHHLAGAQRDAGGAEAPAGCPDTAPPGAHDPDREHRQQPGREREPGQRGGPGRHRDEQAHRGLGHHHGQRHRPGQYGRQHPHAAHGSHERAGRAPPDQLAAARDEEDRTEKAPDPGFEVQIPHRCLPRSRSDGVNGG